MVVALNASARRDLLPGSLASIGVCSGHACDPQLVVVGEAFFFKVLMSFFMCDGAFPLRNIIFPS